MDKAASLKGTASHFDYATLTPFTWLTVGAILGHAERLMARPGAVVRHPTRSGTILGKPMTQKEKRTVF